MTFLIGRGGSLKNVHMTFLVDKIICDASFTLLASKIAGTGCPLGRNNFSSKSCFHFATASNVAALATSKTTNAPTASR